MKLQSSVLALALAISSGVAPNARACTIFELGKSTGAVVGRNLDWHQGPGAYFVNPKGLKKTAFHVDPRIPAADWESAYGSVTLNQYGREMPVGGVNEEGLVIEALWLDGTTVPDRGDKKSTNELQWIQRQLDTAANLDDFFKNAREFAIAPVYAKLHYFACDAKARCGVVEFLKNQEGKPEVVTTEMKDGLTALANDSYADSLKHLGNFEGFGGTQKPVAAEDSPSRFVTAAFGIKSFCGTDACLEPIDWAHYVLKKASQKNGASKTVWSYTYDRAAKEIRMRTTKQREERGFRWGKESFACADGTRMLSVDALPRDSATDDSVQGQLVPYDEKANLALVKASFDHLAPFLPEGTVERFAAYPRTIVCK